MRWSVSGSRTIACLMVAAALIVTVAERAAAQRVPDPAPLEDLDDIDDRVGETDLPAPQPVQQIDAPTRKMAQPFLGVTFDPRIHNAAVARSVNAGSPADLSGVKAGDTIVALNGERVESYDDVLTAVAMLQPGDVLDIEISRRVTVRVRAVLGGQPEDVGRATSYKVPPESLPEPMIELNAPRLNEPLLNRPAAMAPPQAPRPRANNAAPRSPGGNATRRGDTNRAGDANRRGEATERGREENRGRGLFLRRRG